MQYVSHTSWCNIRTYSLIQDPKAVNTIARSNKNALILFLHRLQVLDPVFNLSRKLFTGSPLKS